MFSRLGSWNHHYSQNGQPVHREHNCWVILYRWSRAALCNGDKRYLVDHASFCFKAVLQFLECRLSSRWKCRLESIVTRAGGWYTQYPFLPELYHLQYISPEANCGSIFLFGLIMGALLIHASVLKLASTLDGFTCSWELLLGLSCAPCGLWWHGWRHLELELSFNVAWSRFLLAVPVGWLPPSRSNLERPPSFPSFGTNEDILSGNLIAGCSSGFICYIYSAFIDDSQDFDCRPKGKLSLFCVSLLHVEPSYALFSPFFCLPVISRGLFREAFLIRPFLEVYCWNRRMGLLAACSTCVVVGRMWIDFFGVFSFLSFSCSDPVGWLLLLGFFLSSLMLDF